MLAATALSLTLLPAIRHETVRVWLDAAEIKPHRSRYWLHSQDPEFERKMLDVADFLTWLIKQQPSHVRIHEVLDNLSAHGTEAVEKVVAKHRGRVSLHNTSTHASWLNMVELYFAEVSRNVLRRGNFESIPDLQEKLLAYVAWTNENAGPYRWTYTGQPLTN
ncbi:MAG: transposase [Planctomycetes bacterium]|nr:transposase [Planctomycetota bacterium]